MRDYSEVTREARWNDVRDRARTGALIGAALGGFALMIGLARFVWALVGGLDAEDVALRDFVGMVLYVAGFAAAGAIVGALWNLRERRGGSLLLGLLAAGTVVAAIATFEWGAIWRWGGDTWFTWAVCTAIFGLAAAFQFRRS